MSNWMSNGLYPHAALAKDKILLPIQIWPAPGRRAIRALGDLIF